MTKEQLHKKNTEPQVLVNVINSYGKRFSLFLTKEKIAERIEKGVADFVDGNFLFDWRKYKPED